MTRRSASPKLLKLAASVSGDFRVHVFVLTRVVVVVVGVQIFLAAHLDSGKLDRKCGPSKPRPVVEEVVPGKWTNRF